MFSKRNILLAIILIVVAAGIYAYKEFSRTSTNISEESSAFSLSADELIKEFTLSDSLATSKFVGKIITVSGLVKRIDQDAKELYTISLGDSAGMSSIRCSIDSIYSATAASLKPGMKVEVKGNCTGYYEDELLGTDIILNRCYILDH